MKSNWQLFLKRRMVVAIANYQKRYGIDRKMLREWVCKFDLYGEGGLPNSTYIKASGASQAVFSIIRNSPMNGDE